MQKSRYNIAHIMPWQKVGGTECATLRIAQGVEGEEFNNIFFLLPEADAVKQIFEAEGFETLDYQEIEPSYRHGIAFLRDSYSLAQKLKKNKIDLVHCSDLPASYHAALAGRLAGIPVLCHIRNRYAELSRRDQSFLFSVNHFAFVSKESWKHFAYKVPARRGTVVYDGIDVLPESFSDARESVCRQYNIPESAKIIGMVARVAIQKDYATLVRAAARIVAVEKNVRFLIVGDHSGTLTYRKHFEEVKQLITANGLDPYFIFTDFQSDVIRFLEAMDIFVLSTHFEGLPLVIIEAMAQGKPVIATAVDGIPEIIVPEQTGLLHDHEDDEQLAARILALLRDEEYAVRLGETARETVKKDWSRERFAEDMKNLYRKILVGKEKKIDNRRAENLSGQFKEKI